MSRPEEFKAMMGIRDLDENCGIALVDYAGYAGHAGYGDFNIIGGGKWFIHPRYGDLVDK